MINIGDRIRVDGREVTIESIWSQGAHKRFNLSDGTSSLDLHTNPGVEVLQKKETPKETRKWQWPNLPVDRNKNDEVDELGV
jgi:hypothetical protein